MSDIPNHQCNALTGSGCQCSKHSRWRIPTYTHFQPEFSGYRRQGRDVYLCEQHRRQERRLRNRDQRLPLVDGGFLGSWNKHRYGNMVLDVRTVDWDSITALTVPMAWIGDAPLPEPKEAQTDGT